VQYQLRGRFVLTRDGEYRLGAGGMAEVYEAEDLWNKDRRVAIKVMAHGRRGHLDHQLRFAREMRLTSRMQGQPNVVQFIDYGDEPDIGPWMAMDLVEGLTLRQLLDQHGRLTPERAVEILAGVARGIASMHAAGMVHRDIKPANIFGADQAEPAAGDLGTALDDDPNTRATPSGWVVATKEYGSPEQLRGEPVGPPSDVYSLAVVLFEMLTGTLPPVPTAEQPNDVGRLRAASGSADVTNGMLEVVAIGMSMDPDQRYATVQDLALAARTALEGLAARRPDRDPTSDTWAIPQPGAPVQPNWAGGHFDELDEVEAAIARVVRTARDFVLTYARAMAIGTALLVGAWVAFRFGLVIVDGLGAIATAERQMRPWPELGIVALLAIGSVVRAGWRPPFRRVGMTLASSARWLRARWARVLATIAAVSGAGLLLMEFWKVAPDVWNTLWGLPSAARALLGIVLLVLAGSRSTRAMRTLRAIGHAVRLGARRLPRIVTRGLVLSPMMLLCLSFANRAELERAIDDLQRNPRTTALATAGLIVLGGLLWLRPRLRVAVPLGSVAVIAALLGALVLAPDAVRQTLPGDLSLVPAEPLRGWPPKLQPTLDEPSSTPAPPSKRKKKKAAQHAQPSNNHVGGAAPTSGGNVRLASTSSTKSPASRGAAKCGSCTTAPKPKPKVGGRSKPPPRNPQPAPEPPGRVEPTPEQPTVVSTTHSHSEQSSCVNGACTTTVCDNGQCSTTQSGSAPTAESGGGGSSSQSQSTVCTDGSCVTQTCDANGCGTNR
jgi:tRNA A-37 threonylcarbamoyl transferase component Bud32